MKISVISDIHGNSWALEAVVNDIRKNGSNFAVNLGDTFYGPLDPKGTAKILSTLNIPAVMGNQDRILLEKPKAGPGKKTLQYTLSQLRIADMEWLESLNRTETMFDDDFLLCHGTPTSDEDYLLWEVTEDGKKTIDSKQLSGSLSSFKHKIVLCAHDHLSNSIKLPNSKLIINPGSVGLPAYEEDLPYPHKMEAGSPHARYATIEKSGFEWIVSIHPIEYDWPSAAKAAEQNGRPDWARWLLTGRA